MKIPGADEALEHIASWAARGRWKEQCQRVLNDHFEPVCIRAGIDEDELARLLGEHYHIIQGCAFEDFLSRRLGPKGRNVIDDYLNQRAWQESMAGRDYLRALRTSVLSLYEVVQVKRGRGLVLRDLVRGGAFVEVDERLGSESAVRWDRLGVRVLTIAGRQYLSGAVLAFPLVAAEAVLRVSGETPERLKDALAEQLAMLSRGEPPELEGTLSAPTFMPEEASRIICCIWLAHTIRQLKGPPPRLTNFDGELVVLTKVRYPVAQESRAEVARLLDGMAELVRSPEQDGWSWHKQDEQARAAKANSGLAQASWVESGALVLGRIELAGKWLVLEVNSAARGARGQQMLTEKLGGLVGKSMTEMQSVEGALEQERRSKGQRAGSDVAPQLSPAAIAGVMREFLDRHYRGVIDEPLPAIGNLVPSQAVATSVGREKGYRLAQVS
jgi:hypothetical protein